MASQNRTGLATLCLVLLVSLAGCAGVGAGPGDEGASVEAGTPSGTASVAEPTPSPSPSPTPTSTVTPAPERSVLEAAALETAVLTEVNAARTEAGLTPLERRSDIDAAARFHADNLAAQGFIAASAGGYNATARHAAFEIEHRCKVLNNARDSIERGAEVEVSGAVRSDSTHTVSGQAVTVSNETHAAAVLVEGWLENGAEPLRFSAGSKVGIGANVTDTGRAFVNVVVCS
jgi:hypothetical protein